MSDDELKQIRYALRRLDEHQEEQTDALDRVADQLEIQNAILLEVVSALDRSNQIAMGRDPDDYQTGRGLASSVEDNVLNLAESVDLDDARRWADE